MNSALEARGATERRQGRVVLKLPREDERRRKPEPALLSRVFIFLAASATPMLGRAVAPAEMIWR